MRKSLFLALLVPTSMLGAQQSDRVENFLRNCDDEWRNRRERFCQVRDTTITAASGSLFVDALQNGGVAFVGWDRSDVRVSAMIQTQADTREEAEELARQVRIVIDGGRIRADGPPSRRYASWWVSYEVMVPRKIDLEADTHNGGVSVEGVEGRMSLRAVNGGISVRDVGGDVRAETTNGGVRASLTGTTWKGQGLDLETTNGGVTLEIPRGYNAELETGTVNGGMNIDFPITVRGSIGRRITTRLGSGGPRVRATTTNGGVRIRQR